MKFANRGDDGDCMTGVIKKHKIAERTGPTGDSKVAKIEFYFGGAQSGDWVLFQTKLRATPFRTRQVNF